MTFVDTDTEQKPPVSTVAQRIKQAEGADATDVTVTVAGRYRVVWDGKPYLGGDQLTVPNAVARRWFRWGWIEDGGLEGPEPSLVKAPQGAHRFLTPDEPKGLPGLGLDELRPQIDWST